MQLSILKTLLWDFQTNSEVLLSHWISLYITAAVILPFHFKYVLCLTFPQKPVQWKAWLVLTCEVAWSQTVWASQLGLHISSSRLTAAAARVAGAKPASEWCEMAALSLSVRMVSWREGVIWEYRSKRWGILASIIAWNWNNSSSKIKNDFDFPSIW